MNDIRAVTPLPLSDYKIFSESWSTPIAHFISTDSGYQAFSSKCLDFLGVKYYLTTQRILNKCRSYSHPIGSWITRLHNLKYKELSLQYYNLSIRGTIEGDLYVNGISKFIIQVRPENFFSFSLENNNYTFSVPGKRIINLTPYIGKTVHIKLVSKGWTSLKNILFVEEFCPDLKKWNLVFSQGIFNVYKNHSAQPVIRFASKIKYIEKDNFIEGISCNEKTYYIKNVPHNLRNSLPQTFQLKEGNQVIATQLQNLNQYQIKFKNIQPIWLIIAINNDGNWKAFLDGINIKIYSTIKPFMAIPIIKPAQHTLVLKYRPSSFYIGCLISLLTLFFLFLISYFKYYIKK